MTQWSGCPTAKKTKANTRGRDGTLHDANRATLILIPDSLSLARVPLGRGRVGDHWGRPQTAPASVTPCPFAPLTESI
jgi:hypothetical protein